MNKPDARFAITYSTILRLLKFLESLFNEECGKPDRVRSFQRPPSLFPARVGRAS